MAGTWFIYLLYHPVHHRTYIGATTNPARRLRQHNGELRGGARSTSRLAPGWHLVVYVSGFRDRREAYRWERICKNRAIGFDERGNALAGLALGICPMRNKNSIQYPVPSGLSIGGSPGGMLYEQAIEEGPEAGSEEPRVPIRRKKNVRSRKAVPARITRKNCRGRRGSD